MNFLKQSTLLTALVTLLQSTAIASSATDSTLPPPKQVGKNPIAQTKQVFPIPPESTHQQCIDNCLHQNQHVSMGFEVIEHQCRIECRFQEALQQSQSQVKEEYTEGIKSLCDSEDRRAVAPLIKALKRDLDERTGVWAWIIPTLGVLGDQQAVAILIKTLTIQDDDWLGREMSAQSLGLLRDPTAIPSLLASVWRADTRDSAITALANFQDERIIPALLSALDPEEEKETRETALKGLENLGSMAIPEMIISFSDVSPEYPQTKKRLLLCHLLGRSDDTRAIQMLKDSQTDPDKAIAECAEQYASNI